jgi:hypothetical protein
MGTVYHVRFKQTDADDETAAPETCGSPEY